MRTLESTSDLVTAPTSVPPDALSLAPIIPMNVHAAAEYTGALALIAAPLLFGWRGPAAAVSVASGAATLGTSLMTDYDLSLAKVIPIQVHAMADYLNGGLLALAPAACGYSGSAPGRFHMMLGLGIVGMSLLTAYRPSRRSGAGASALDSGGRPGTQLGMRVGPSAETAPEQVPARSGMAAGQRG
jgi:hypothetical protein